MSLARAFTRRNKRSVDHSAMQRGTSVKYPPGTINRNLISLPTELISTTNVQALTAPDIRSISAGSSTGSLNSVNDSDFSTIDRSFLNNTGSDTSSVDSSGPATPVTPANDEIKSFFDSKQSPVVPAIASPPALDTPSVPQRAPSHSKKAHVELSRKRSIQRMSPPPTSISKPTIRDSTEFFTKPTDPSHPFGRELAQVNEIAEEFGATARLLEDEEQDIMSKGLYKFGVEDYLDEIAGLYGGIFEDQLTSLAKPWI